MVGEGGGKQVSCCIAVSDLCFHMFKYCKTKQTFTMNLLHGRIIK